MRKRVLAAVAALCLVVPAAASAAVHVRAVDTTGYPRVRVTVVTDKPSSKPPTLLENGQKVDGANAVNLGSTKSVVLAIDRSRSMIGAPLNTAVAAAKAFADAKPTSDQIAVSTFASQALPPTPFSPSTTDSDQALRSVAVDSTAGTRMYDDLLLDVQALAHQNTAGKVIIVVTDGNETSSTEPLPDLVSAARKAHVSIYVIGIESHLFSPGDLKKLAAGTGGHYYAAASPGFLHQIYAGIADELKRTWQVEYLTAARPGDKITLTAKIPGQGAAVLAADISGAGSISPSKSSLPTGAFSTGGVLVLAAIVGLLVMLAFRFLFKKSKTEELRRRIQPHIGEEKEKKAKAKREKPNLLLGLFSSTEHVLGKSNLWTKLGRLLERADLPLKTVEFAYIILLSGLAVGFLVSVMGLSGIFLLGAFLVGASIPILFVMHKAKKRLNAFDEQLPDLLMAVAASLKAGHSFKQGIQTIVEEARDPAKKEFQRVLAEASLGRQIEASLADMAERLGSKNFSFIVTAVTIQNQVGGSLAGLFDMVADTVRQRQTFSRKIKALTAMGRASAYVLIALPIFLAMLLTAVNHKYMSPLYFTSAGHTLIIVGLVAMCIGSFILRKIVSFKG
ncbi:MAG TPA: VWA domain-containing protein [Gaiellaceae bacterium]|nr:VWA domain-containing protein [Gaiellaceae bacterium]